MFVGTCFFFLTLALLPRVGLRWGLLRIACAVALATAFQFDSLMDVLLVVVRAESLSDFVGAVSSWKEVIAQAVAGVLLGVLASGGVYALDLLAALMAEATFPYSSRPSISALQLEYNQPLRTLRHGMVLFGVVLLFSSPHIPALFFPLPFANVMQHVDTVRALFPGAVNQLWTFSLLLLIPLLVLLFSSYLLMFGLNLYIGRIADRALAGSIAIPLLLLFVSSTAYFLPIAVQQFFENDSLPLFQRGVETLFSLLLLNQQFGAAA